MISTLLPVVSPPSNTRPALELQAECPTLAVIVKSRVLQTFQDLSRHVDLCGVQVILIRITNIAEHLLSGERPPPQSRSPLWVWP